MVITERSIWVELVVETITTAVYIVIVLTTLATTPPEQIAYQPTLWWILGISIGANIVGSMFFASARSKADARRDQRDVAIGRFGARTGYGVLVVFSLTAMVLAVLSVHPFWIANALFLGFALASITSGASKVVAYRRGLATW